MNPLDYQKLASRTECEQGKVCDRMADVYPVDPTGTGPRDLLLPVRLNHAVLGMAGEVGELAGALEKWLYYGRALDRENVIEEMGDLLWYVAQLCNAVGVDMSAVMEANILKLRARYPEKYSNSEAGRFSEEASANRDYAKEKEAMRSGRAEEAARRVFERIDANRVSPEELSSESSGWVEIKPGAPHSSNCDCTLCTQKRLHSGYF